MIDMSIAAIAAASPPAAQPLPAAQPTAQQTARFEQLQAGPHLEATQYAAPLPAPARPGGELLDYAKHLSAGLQAQFEKPGVQVDPQRWPQLHLVQETVRDLRSFSLTTMQFECLAKGVELLDRSAQVLYQQTG